MFDCAICDFRQKSRSRKSQIELSNHRKSKKYESKTQSQKVELLERNG